ncbi:MAG TPA: TonB-dependent receptor, partial [Tepidisphaeraceae bacterium]|nr:TonB-dependent receptor [Tepidisphaeraceae bacterium]
FSMSSAAAGMATTTTPTTQPAGADLTNLSIEDLMNVEVTSVAKQPQKLADAPAAVTVIGQEDIQRSGMDSIPELLRLVPGMDVAQIDANRWAITSRGFNGLFADDLLVLEDGRSLYTPVFGGVRWSTVDYPLDDLDRIEVIRGPGATLWGSNAVNGVVNIETKSADQTQGWMADSRVGTDADNESVRYGGQIDGDTYYRVFEKVGYTDGGVDSFNNPTHDDWSSYEGGFRIDRQASREDTLTFEGQGYYQPLEEVAEAVPPPIAQTDYENGADVLGRWTHVQDERNGLSLEAYWDRQISGDFPANVQQDTFDSEFQDRFAIGNPLEITWGLGARDSEILLGDDYPGSFSPSHVSDYLYNGFIQDQITLIPDRLQWFSGTKLEYDKFVNFQVQPSTRLLFTPNDQNSFWGAISRSVRVPSIYQEETVSLGGFISTHNPNPSAEQEISYEVGYKTQPVQTVTADVTGFYNVYHDLINYDPLVTGPPYFIPYGVSYANALEGDTYGTELSLDWQAMPQWRLGASYSFCKVILRPQGNNGALVPNPVIRSVEGSTPQNQFQVHSDMDVTKNIQFNTSVYYVDALPTLVSTYDTQDVPAHVRLDAGVSWKPTPSATVSFGVQNILQARHSEFGNFDSQLLSSEVQRAYYLRLQMSF